MLSSAWVSPLLVGAMVCGGAVLGASSPAAATQGTGTACPGTYAGSAYHQATNRLWDNTASSVTDSGTTCSKARAVVTVYLNKSCPECNVDSMDGYRVASTETTHSRLRRESDVTLTRGAVVVRLHVTSTTCDCPTDNFGDHPPGVPPPTGLTACSGAFITPATENRASGTRTWANVASHVRQRGTSCHGARAVGRAYAHMSCGTCKAVHRARGYAIKAKYDYKHAAEQVTATREGVTVAFRLESYLEHRHG